MSKFIPGPWSVSELKGDVRLICRSNDTTSYPIAKVLIELTNRFGTGNTDTTARLIAAAPDMLHALENLEMLIHYAVDKRKLNREAKGWIRQATAAILKAKGGDE